MLPEGPLVKEKRGAGSGRPVDANSRAHVHERTAFFREWLSLPGSAIPRSMQRRTTTRWGYRDRGSLQLSIALPQEEEPMTTILDFNNTEERLERIKDCDWTSCTGSEEH